jgi:hypothetical protein
MFPFLFKLCADRGYQRPEFRRALKKGLARANLETINRLAHIEAAVPARKSPGRRGRIADAVPGGRRAISFGGACSLDRDPKTFKPAVAIVIHLPSLLSSPGGLDQIGQRPSDKRSPPSAINRSPQLFCIIASCRRKGRAPRELPTRWLAAGRALRRVPPQSEQARHCFSPVGPCQF